MPGSTESEVQRAARYVSHTSIKQVAAWIAGDAPPKHLEGVVTRLRANDQVTDVANAFVALNEERERADYDHEADFTRPGAWAQIERATLAVRLLRDKEADNDFRSFLGLIVLRTSLRREAQ